jgi:hypothetical protein
MDPPERWFPFSTGSSVASSVLIACLVIYYSYWKWFARSSLLHRQSVFSGAPVISACKDANCIRCQRYRQMQDRAAAKIVWIVHDLKRANPAMTLNPRIQQGVQRSKRGGQHTSCIEDGHPHDDYLSNPFQAPTVLWVPRLPSQEVVTHLHHEACQYLRQQSTSKIVLEALKCFSDSDWTTNHSPQGSWKVLHVLNQGSWNPSIVHRYDSPSLRSLLDLVRGIPGLLEKCLFGNAMISTIYPGTIIEPHCGPTNVRHRLQFLLEDPVGRADSAASQESTSMIAGGQYHKNVSLFVGKEENLTWNTNHTVFVFDDSFVHSVHYRTNQNTPQIVARTVLIVDLWHPSLDELEKTLLRDLYPPLENVRVRRP